MRRIFLSTLFALTAAYTYGQQQAAAPEKQEYSLKDAIDFALKNNNGTKNARLDYLSTKKRALEVITIGLPTINANVDYQNFFQLPVQLIPGELVGAPGKSIELKFGKPQNLKFGVDASQLIFDARYFVGLKARKEMVFASEKAVDKSEIDTRKQVYTAYYAALVAEESYKLIQGNLSTLEKLLSETKALYKEGFAEELDVQRMQLSIATLKSAIKDVQNKSVNAKDNLKFVMGVSQDADITLTENLDALIAQAAPMDNFAFDSKNRIEYTLLNTQKNLLGYDIKQKQAGYYPAMYFFFNYGVNAQRDKFDFWNNGKWFRQGIWGVTLKIPVFDSFNRYAIVQQAKIKQVQAMNDLENFKQASKLQATVARNNYATAIDQLKDQKQNLELAKKIQNKSMIMFKEGVGSSLALAQADADVVNTQLAYIQAVFNVLNSKTELDAALGKLNN